MITLLLVLLAILAIAAGFGVARETNTTDENLTWAGYSRSRVKRCKLTLEVQHLAVNCEDYALHTTFL